MTMAERMGFAAPKSRWLPNARVYAFSGPAVWKDLGEWLETQEAALTILAVGWSEEDNELYVAVEE